MGDDRRVYEVHLYSPEYSAETYSEVHWRGIVRMDREERESLAAKCQRVQKDGNLTTFSIRELPPSITIEDLRRQLPAKFRDLLGYGGPKAVEKS